MSLRIAGDPVQLTTARAFAGSIARVMGVDDDGRQDIRLAVSELATLLIRAGTHEIRVVAEIDTDIPLLRLETEGRPPPIPQETTELLSAIGGALWSIDQPWVIHLGEATNP